MGQVLDLKGKKFGQLLAVAKADSRANCAMWVCVCDCGKTRKVKASALVTRHTQSCGCLADTTKFKNIHGKSRSKEYRSWRSMIRRCETYPTYIAKGIKVCQLWRNSFSAFYSELGDCPASKTSIDRIDNSRGYEPGNCRWATVKQQNNNCDTNRYVCIDGVSKTVSQWSEIFGVNRETIYTRLRKGMDPVLAVTTPTLKRS